MSLKKSSPSFLQPGLAEQKPLDSQLRGAACMQAWPPRRGGGWLDAEVRLERRCREDKTVWCGWFGPDAQLVLRLRGPKAPARPFQGFPQKHKC